MPDSKDSQTYRCTYKPTAEGKHTISVSYGGQQVPKSPFAVDVKRRGGDVTRVALTGPGIDKSGVVVNERTHFTVNTTGFQCTN